MMDKDIRAAFDAVRPSDELRNDILNMAEEEKPAAKRSIRPVLYRVAALAATLAIILTAALWPRESDDGFVTAPGVLKVYAYDLTSGSSIYEMESYELKENAIWNPYPWGIMLNSLYGLPIRITVEEETFQGMDLTLEVSLNYGTFFGDIYLEKYKENPNDPVASLKSADLGKTFVIENGETIFWSYIPNEKEQMKNDRIFADVVIKADGHIVGYAVIEIRNSITSPDMYIATRRKAECFPLVNGEYQEVTEEYIAERIAKCKEK